MRDHADSSVTNIRHRRNRRPPNRFPTAPAYSTERVEEQRQREQELEQYPRLF